MSFASGAATYYAEDVLRERLTGEELVRLDEEALAEVDEDFAPRARSGAPNASR
jgi:hypothetical protein